MSSKCIERYEPEALDDFRSLKGKGGHFNRGLFIAESEKIVRKILASAFEVPKALMTPEYFEKLRPLIDARHDVTEIYLAPESEMEQIVGYHLHQGLMLAVKIPARGVGGNSHSPQGELEFAHTLPDDFLVVALDAIADAENMGAIIRNAAAFGAHALIVDDRSCNPYLRRSVRVSMGTVVDVEIIRVSDLASALQELKALRECKIIGAAQGPNAFSLDTTKREGSTVLVFGSEGWGMRRAVIDVCDQLAWIPMQPAVDSLNVAIASGIFLHHFQR
jgi:tRNA G18 (ribose-2'-O)-methylase SpoU